MAAIIKKGFIVMGNKEGSNKGSIQNFKSFDPLKAKSTANNDVAARALKRELNNILSSYVGWYDPFCELIQNSLDAVEGRAAHGGAEYAPSIWITVNIRDNSLAVTDNGIGLGEQEFQQFLAPDFSFKSNGRGHKGVGATYLAYGFNYMQICTKTEDFSATGKIVNAREWLSDKNPSGNPQVKYDSRGAMDKEFDNIDKGVSIFLKFDETTHPKDLDWIKASDTDSWFKILSVKTGLGSFRTNDKIHVSMTVIDKQGNKTNYEHHGIGYLWPHTIVPRSASYGKIAAKAEELYRGKGQNYTMPSRLRNLDVFYDTWGPEELKSLIKLTAEELAACDKYKPSTYFAYAHSVKVWQSFNESLGIRSGHKILYGGIQIAADDMPQGEVIQIPLDRYIGRQNQVHFLFHFNNCTADLGRKGFKSEVVDFAKEIAKKLVDGPLQKYKHLLRPNTGAVSDLSKKKEVQDWKVEMEEHEAEKPLELINENFFLPLRKISITSEPTREQDVIALFNQLLAGGVIRGIRIMSTNERLTYDGLYRIVIEEPKDNHIYDKNTNPLGILKDVMGNFDSLPFRSYPEILEYKLSLDGLIEDIEDGSKNSNDIGLVVVWETGKSYQGNYKITSLLDENNLSFRQYHGLTHVMTNLTTNQREMDLIVLKELIDFLNNPRDVQRQQIEKYDEY